MNNLDQKIQAALQRANADPSATEPNLAEEVIGTFRGRQRMISVIAFVCSLVLLAGALWAGNKFLSASTVGEQLSWGGLALVLFLIVLFVKVWFWLQMQTNRILREVKRLELAVLTAKRD